MERHWTFMIGAALAMPSTSNGRPESFSRSAMKSLGVRWPISPKITGTVAPKNSRSAQMLAPQAGPETVAGVGARASISARITWLSQ